MLQPVAAPVMSQTLFLPLRVQAKDMQTMAYRGCRR